MPPRSVAIDAAPHAGFFIAHELLGSQVKFYKMNIYDLTPEMLAGSTWCCVWGCSTTCATRCWA